MARRAPRDPATNDVLRQLAARRRRRRWLAWLFAVVVGLLLAFLLGAALIAGLRMGSGEAATTSSEPASSPSTSGPPTVSTWTLPPRPSTTLPPPDEPSTTAPSATPTTTGAPVATPSSTAPPNQDRAKGLVVIDPGHQAKGDNKTEPIGPGSSEVKPRVSSGTRGVATGTPEHVLTLAVGQLLREELEGRGIKVIMTRTSADVSLSNVERTKIANQAQADLFIRVHADGAESASRRGIHVLYPAVRAGWTEDIAAPSKRAAELAQRELIAATGAPDLGTNARDDITGFNWSDVPVIIPEIGFMTNPEEDRLLATEAYRRKVAGALAQAAARFLEERR